MVVIGVGNLTSYGRGGGEFEQLSLIEIMAEFELEFTLENFKEQNCVFVTEWLKK